MLTTVSFISLKLGLITPDFSALLTGCHVVEQKAELESGISQMGHQFQDRMMLQHSTESEEMMELSS